MTENKQVQVRPVDALKRVMASASVQEQFKNAMGENSNLFVASLIDLYASDTYLQNCDPSQVVMEALKAAVLKLPIAKTLGFAYIVPYKKNGKPIPQFQLGYRGMVQLAQRSGIYRYINAGPVYEGEYRGFCKLTGELDLTGEKKSDTVIGYFSYIETVNGFKKCMFATREDIERHAKKYSKSYSKDSSPWQTEFDAMAEKTMLRKLLSKYGLMSIEMAQAMKEDDPDEDYRENANSEIIEVDPGATSADHGQGPPENIDTTTGEVMPQEGQGHHEEVPPWA